MEGILYAINSNVFVLFYHFNVGLSAGNYIFSIIIDNELSIRILSGRNTLFLTPNYGMFNFLACIVHLIIPKWITNKYSYFIVYNSQLVIIAHLLGSDKRRWGRFLPFFVVCALPPLILVEFYSLGMIA